MKDIFCEQIIDTISSSLASPFTHKYTHRRTFHPSNHISATSYEIFSYICGDENNSICNCIEKLMQCLFFLRAKTIKILLKLFSVFFRIIIKIFLIYRWQFLPFLILNANYPSSFLMTIPAGTTSELWRVMVQIKFNKLFLNLNFLWIWNYNFLMCSQGKKSNYAPSLSNHANMLDMMWIISCTCTTEIGREIRKSASEN